MQGAGGKAGQGVEAGVIFHQATGVETEPPRTTPARGPPLWDGCDAQMGDGVEVEPDWDDAAQLVPDFEVDQRIRWWGVATAVWPTLRGRLRPSPPETGHTEKSRATGPEQAPKSPN